MPQSLNPQMHSLPDPHYPPQCQLCQFYTRNPHLRCTVHPTGLASDECLDFVATAPRSRQRRIAPQGKQLCIAQPSEAEEQWQPEGAAYYNGELVLQPRQRPLTAQLDLLDLQEDVQIVDCRPAKGGSDKSIGSTQLVQVHWDCSNCGWMTLFERSASISGCVSVPLPGFSSWQPSGTCDRLDSPGWF
ncbi:hypothetical protein [Leptolyngbya sp. FACHB-711]|uniref:hypothetical protein n=1 Tax=Leptolyngbya sp. FACHB-711 TaxID=2692813 RepID=UPI00168A0E7B|nr:hypothetical protein [Leptolyngbya sp. FACHB-711]MBD1848479.1 hypothetical protein [Cyanobacteria bacterium FACHB-502]MBD2024961.1 hypothetical protein [Leptolyngbya sp. FACHB-711]